MIKQVRNICFSDWKCKKMSEFSVQRRTILKINHHVHFFTAKPYCEIRANENKLLSLKSVYCNYTPTCIENVWCDEWLRWKVIELECSRPVKFYIKAPILVNIRRMWLWFAVVSTSYISFNTDICENLYMKKAKTNLLTEDKFENNWETGVSQFY